MAAFASTQSRLQQVERRDKDTLRWNTLFAVFQTQLILLISLKTLLSFESFSHALDAVLNGLSRITLEDGFNMRIFFSLTFWNSALFIWANWTSKLRVLQSTVKIFLRCWRSYCKSGLSTASAQCYRARLLRLTHIPTSSRQYAICSSNSATDLCAILQNAQLCRAIRPNKQGAISKC